MTLRCAFLRCLSNANPTLLRLVFLLRVFSLARLRRSVFVSSPSACFFALSTRSKKILVRPTAPYTCKRERPPFNFPFRLRVRDRLELHYFSRSVLRRLSESTLVQGLKRQDAEDVVTRNFFHIKTNVASRLGTWVFNNYSFFSFHGIVIYSKQNITVTCRVRLVLTAVHGFYYA